MKKEKNDPLFYSVKDVCNFLRIKPYILDYWIKRLPELKPLKIGKRKYYKKDQVDILSQVKKLLDEGYSFEGIRKKIIKHQFPLFPELKGPKSSIVKTQSEDIIQESNLRKVIKEVLRELKEIYKNLNSI